MKEKIVVEYDRSSGQVTDAAGCYIGCYLGAVSFDPAFDKIQAVIDLHKAGFNAEEIVDLEKGGVLKPE